jgi:EmrB/QacA subfamily drug resistance transporter
VGEQAYWNESSTWDLPLILCAAARHWISPQHAKTGVPGTDIDSRDRSIVAGNCDQLSLVCSNQMYWCLPGRLSHGCGAISLTMIFQQQRFVLIALLVAGAFFMENLDGTVIATALPQMAPALHTAPIALSAGMSAYMLTLAVFIPISGWVADRFGSQTVFATAIAIFTFSSILCGLSHQLWQFTAARVLQGMGGAMMVPVGRLVVLRNTEKKDLMRSIAYIVWPGLVAPILGPPVGGFITTYASWRWIFFLNVPLGVLGILLTFVLVPNHRAEEKNPLDWLGFLLSGLSCFSLMYGLDFMEQQPIPWLKVGALWALSIACAGLVALHARHHPFPLIDLSALRIPTFATVIFGGSLFRVAIGTVPFLLPMMFQVGFGMSAFTSGLLMIALFAGNLGMKTLTTPILRRFGFRSVLITNGALAALSIGTYGFLTANMPKMLFAAVLFLGGLFRSMQFTSLTTLAFADIPSEKITRANTFLSTVQQISMGMGVGVGAVALHVAALLHGVDATALTVAHFHLAFFLVGAIALAGIADCFKLKPDAGAIVSGHLYQN